MPVPKGQLKAIDSKIAAIQKAQRAELQLKLFPDWPDDRRGAPNEVIRSAIFGVVRTGRKMVANLPVAGQKDQIFTLTGWRLDQYDCDISGHERIRIAKHVKRPAALRFRSRASGKGL